MSELLINTGQTEAWVAWRDEEKKLVRRSWQFNVKETAEIIKKIDQLVSSEQLTWEKIGAIGAYDGPTTFYSACRAGQVVARVLAVAYGKKFFTFDDFQALAGRD